MDEKVLSKKNLRKASERERERKRRIRKVESEDKISEKGIREEKETDDGG